MKWIVTILISMYLGNSLLLVKLFPKVSTDWMEFYHFWQMRSRVYEIMFALLCSLVYESATDKWTKSLITFLGVLVIGSVVDKVFFSITTYIYSDILLVIIALALSTIIFKRHDR